MTDKSLDVLKCFSKKIKELKIKVEYETKVEEILVNKITKSDSDNKKDGDNEKNGNDENDKISVIGVKTNKGRIDADKVILATGGKSYPLTGSTGDGYALAENGHSESDLTK